MATVNISPNMNLPIPVTTQTVGPDWANDYNNSLGVVDGHNHSPGSGVQINPAGININASLPFNGNGATGLASSSYVTQGSQPTAVTAAYAYGTNGELYWNDGAGNKVQLTSGGVVNATSSGISSGTASASFVSSVLVVTQSTGVGAPIDAASYILRYNGSYPSPSGNYITLAAPSALSGGYQLTFPAAVSGTNGALIASSTSGVLSYSTPDQVGQGMTATGANAVAASRTRASGSTVGTGGIATSSSSGSFSTASSSFVNVTNLSVTITTSGRPIYISLVPVGGSFTSDVSASNGSSGSVAQAAFQILNSTTSMAYATLISATTVVSGSGLISIASPPGAVFAIDSQVAGTYTYVFQAKAPSGSPAAAVVTNCVLVAYEL